MQERPCGEEYIEVPLCEGPVPPLELLSQPTFWRLLHGRQGSIAPSTWTWLVLFVGSGRRAELAKAMIGRDAYATLERQAMISTVKERVGREGRRRMESPTETTEEHEPKSLEPIIWPAEWTFSSLEEVKYRQQQLSDHQDGRSRPGSVEDAGSRAQPHSGFGPGVLGGGGLTPEEIYRREKARKAGPPLQ
jgi:hypothetical protein